MRKRLVVGKEIVRAREISLRLLVIPRVNRVVRALEQAAFGVLDKLEEVGIQAVIPPKSNRKEHRQYDEGLYIKVNFFSSRMTTN